MDRATNNLSSKIAGQKPASKESIEGLLKIALHLPKFWIIAITIFIFFSMFNISWVPSKGLSIIFQISNATAILLALTWLPVLLGIFALVGGGIKTPAGEFSSVGLTSLIPLLKQDTLGILISETTVAEEKASTQEKVNTRQIRQELEEAYVSRVPRGQISNELRQLSEQYKQLRTTMSSGSERTFRMESIVGGMRALISQAQLSANEINAYLQSDDEGMRLLGISYVQLSGDERLFEQIIQVTDNPKSAFEQYQALRAIEKMLPHLNKTQKQHLKEVLIKQRDYDSKKKQWIIPNSDRDWLSTRILSIINQEF